MATANRKVYSIARSFILLYYKMMSENPHDLHKFYKEQSDFIHPILGKSENETEINVRGITAIRDRVSLLNLAGVDISLGGAGGSFNAQPSDNDCVLIICNGTIQYSNSKLQLPFVQTFMLAPQSATGEGSKKSFYIRNSVFRIISGVSNTQSDVAQGSTVQSGNGFVAPVQVPSPVPLPVVATTAPAPAAVTATAPSTTAAPVPKPGPTPAPAPAPAASVKEVTLNETPKQSGQANPPTNSKRTARVEQEQSKTSVSEETTEVVEEKGPDSASSSSSSDETILGAPSEPVEKKVFSYASAVTNSSDTPAAAAVANSKISASGGPGWNVAGPKKSEKQVEKARDENRKEMKESKEKSSSDGTQKESKKENGGGKREEKELGPSLYLNKLDPATTKEDILKMFSCYGKVGKIDLNSRGFAFVEYDNRASVLAALSAHKNSEAKHKLKGKIIEIQEKQGSKISGKGKQVSGGNQRKSEKEKAIAGNSSS